MKINRRGFLASASAASVLANSDASVLAKGQLSLAASDPYAEPFSVAGKDVTVYTTAHQSDHRLSATDKFQFKHLGQPLESQICVFVDPSRTFQTILGIGGAITDASAETFAKLPAAKQLEILNAYFDA